MGYILALITVFIWSLNIIVAKYFASSLPPFDISVGRWAVASIILLLISGKEIWRQRKIFIQKFWILFQFTFTGIILSNTLIYYAGETISSIDMGLLSITSPIFLILLGAIFLGISLNKYQIMGILVALVGVLIILTNGDITQIEKIKIAIGDFYMLFNSFIFATYSFLQYKRPKEISQMAMLGATAVLGSIIMIPIAVFQSTYPYPTQFRLEDLYLVIYLGVFNSVIAYLCWNTALQKIGNLKTSIIYYLMPLFASIEAYFIFGSKINASEFVGGALVILGVLTITLLKRPYDPKQR